MRAVAVFPQTRDVRLIDLPRPRVVRPTEVLVRTLQVGVCGTDREICGFHYGTTPVGEEHLVIGHECVGEVVEMGSGVKGLAVGDRVVPTVRRRCGVETCAACNDGRQDFCSTGRFTERGIKERHGYMTELLVEDEENLVRVPAELGELAALLEPLTIAEKALIEVWQVQQRLPWACPSAGNKRPGHCHHAVVLGAGPIGLLGAMAFANAGFSTFVYSREEPSSDKADLVRSFGATYVSAADTPVSDLMRRVGTIDVVYEATGASRLSFEVLTQIGPNAAFVFTGVPGLRAKAEVDTDLIMRNMVLKNQVLLGTVNAGRDAFEAGVRDLVEFNRRWPESLRRLITGRYRAEDYKRPLLSTDGIKNLITFG
jgi:threonine dehydrogenase-like Zn-dependent dehydrogenase